MNREKRDTRSAEKESAILIIFVTFLSHGTAGKNVTLRFTVSVGGSGTVFAEEIDLA